MLAPEVRPAVALDVDGVVRVLQARVSDELNASKDADSDVITIAAARDSLHRSTACLLGR